MLLHRQPSKLHRIIHNVAQPTTLCIFGFSEQLDDLIDDNKLNPTRWFCGKLLP